MALEHYSSNESLERIYNVLVGVNPADAEETLGQMPYDEALTRIAQVLEGSLGTPVYDPIPGLGAEYGGIYTWTGTVTMTGIPGGVVGTAWTKITGAFQNSMLATTNVTPTPSQDKIVLNDIGVWLVSWSATIIGSPDINYKIEPFCMVGMPQASAGITPYSSGTHAHLSGSGIVYSSGTSVGVSLYILPSVTAAWVRLNSVQLHVQRLGSK